MLHFSYVSIFSNQILENKQVVIPLLVRGSQIGRKNKDSIFMLVASLVLIIKLPICPTEPFHVKVANGKSL